jgi:hypothetical protein
MSCKWVELEKQHYRKKLMEKSRRQREWAVAEFVGAGITKYFLKLNICR